jgi:ring-1,2-phenylacetyl-CoA epoxidase subunit PaaE
MTGRHLSLQSEPVHHLSKSINIIFALMDSIQLKVTGIIPETADAITITLAPADGSAIPYQPGQFLTFLFQRHGHEVRRSFSLSSSPETDKDLAITIKRVVNGEISTYLHHHLATGDILTALPPSGRFTLQPDPSAQRDIFLVAAGSGIAPVYAILQTLLLKETGSHITLIYSNRSETSTIFYRQLNKLAEEYAERFTCIYIFSDPDNKTYRYWAHLNLGLLEELINENIHFDRNKAVFMLCGPFTFMRMAEMTIIAMHFDEGSIHKENFVLLKEPESIPMPVIEDHSDKEVDIRYHGKAYSFKVPFGTPILKAAIANHISLPYSCQGAICGMCAARCKEGKVQMPVNFVLTSDDIKKGWVLTCVGYAATAHVALEFE